MIYLQHNTMKHFLSFQDGTFMAKTLDATWEELRRRRK